VHLQGGLQHLESIRGDFFWNEDSWTGSVAVGRVFGYSHEGSSVVLGLCEVVISDGEVLKEDQRVGPDKRTSKVFAGIP
jgi:hypothetical protein